MSEVPVPWRFTIAPVPGACFRLLGQASAPRASTTPTMPSISAPPNRPPKASVLRFAGRDGAAEDEHDRDDARDQRDAQQAAEGERQALAARAALGLRLHAFLPLLAAALLFPLPAGHGPMRLAVRSSRPCACDG